MQPGALGLIPQGRGHALLALLLLSALWPIPVLAQQPKAGEVTTIYGVATVARPALPQELPLKFKDDVFYRDRIATKESSIVRVLLGGKALVTVRELSVLTITEEPGRATVDLQSGKIALAVARKLMRPGEVIEIRTPNAVASVRGTVAIAELVGSNLFLSLVSGSMSVTLPQLPGVPSQTVQQGTTLQVAPTGFVGTTPISPQVYTGLTTPAGGGGPPPPPPPTPVVQNQIEQISAIFGGPPPTTSLQPTPTQPTPTIIQSVQDPCQINPSSCTPNTPTPTTDLSVSKTASVTQASKSGNTITYTIVVTNSGPDTATGITLTDTLPAGVTLVSAPAGCSGTSTLTCSVGSLSSGGTATVTIVVKTTTPGSITNLAGVTDDQTDPNTVNNTVTAVTTVPSVPPLFPVKIENNSHITLANGVSLGTFFSTGPGTPNQIAIADNISGLTATLTGPLVTASVPRPSEGETGPSVILIRGAGGTPVNVFELKDSNLTSSSAPLFSVTGPGLLVDINTLLAMDPSILTLGGSLLSLSSATLTSSGPVFSAVGDATIADPSLGRSSITQTGLSGAPLIDVSSGTLTVTGAGQSILSLDKSDLTVTGPILQSAGSSSITVGPDDAHRGPVLQLTNTSTATTSADPAFKISEGTLTASTLVSGDATSTLTLNGSLLDLSGGTVTLSKVFDLGTDLTTPTGKPLISVTGGSLNATNLASLGANLILNDSLLKQSGGTVTTTADAVTIGTGHTLTSGTAPVFDVSGGTLTTTGSSDLVDLAGGTLSVGTGGVLSLTAGAGTTPTVTIGGDVLHVASTVTGPGSGSLVAVGAGTLNVTGDIADVASSSALNLNGASLVSVTGGTVAVGGDVLSVTGTGAVSNTAGAAPVIAVGAGGTLTATGAFLNKSGGGTLTLHSALLDLGGGNTGSGSPALLQVAGGTVNDSATLVTVSGTSTLNRPLLAVSGSGTTVAPAALLTLGADLTLNQSLLQQSGGTVTTTADAVTIGTGHTLTSGSAAVFDLTGGTLTTPTLLAMDPSTLTLGGSLLSLSSATLTASGPLFSVVDSTIKPKAGLPEGTTFPLISLSSGTLNVTGADQPVLKLNQSSLTVPGPFLDSVNSDITVSGPLVRLENASTLKNTVGPAIRLSGGSLTADALGISDSTGNKFDLTGTLLNLSNGASVTLRTLGEEVPNNHQDTVTFNLATHEPLINLSSSHLTLTGAGEKLVSFGVDTEMPITQNGVALIATGTSAAPSTISLKGRLLDLGGVTLTDSNPQVQLTNTTLTQGGSDPLIEILGQDVTMTGPAFKAVNSAITAGGPFLHFGTGTLISNTHSAFVEFDPSTASSASNFVLADGGASVTLHGSLLNATDVTLSATSNLHSFFAVVDGASVTTSGTTDPLLNFARVAPGRNTVTAARSFLPLAINTPGSASPSMTLSGPLLNATLTDFRTGDPTANTFTFLFVGDSATLTGTSSSPLMSFDNSTVDTAGNILTLRRSTSAAAPSTLTLSGPLFSATNGSSFNTTSLGFGAQFSTTPAACCSGFTVSQGARLTAATTAPLISLNNSTFNAGPDAQSGGSFFGASDTGPPDGIVAPASVTLGNASVMAGPLLSATDSTITALFSLVNVVRSSLSSNGTGPFISLTGTTGTGSGVTTVSLGTSARTDPLSPGSSALGDVLFLESSPTSGTAASPASVSLAGPLLSATNASLTMTKDVIGVFNGATLTSTTTSPLIQLNNSSLTAGTATINGQVLNVSGTGGAAGSGLATVSLQGPLLNDPASSLTLTGGLAAIFAGGQVTTASTDPFVSITGGSHSIATNEGTALFQLQGRSSATAVDSETGLTLGTDQPLVVGGSPLQVSGATINTQKILKIDTALLAATAPLLIAAGGTNLSTVLDAIHLVQKANVTVTASEMIRLLGGGLTGGTVTVTSGALVNVASGSKLTVNGDFLHMRNAGAAGTVNTLNISNGTLLSVSGGSVVTISGFFVKFIGPQANTINVTNNLTPTFVNGLPVFLGPGASLSNITIKSNWMTAQGGGTPSQILINGVQLPNNANSCSSNCGSLIAISGATSKLTIK